MSIRAILVLLLSNAVLVNVALAQAASEPIPQGYTLLPGDTLEISVWKEPDLQREVLIRPDGRFSFPLMGDIVAIGKTVTEIQDALTTGLLRYIPEAVVTVTVTSVNGNKIYVIGQVRNPGVFIVNPRVDVVQALSMAGGMTPFADVDHVLILRRTSGVQQTSKFNYSEIEKGRNLDQNIELAPGDVVIVP